MSRAATTTSLLEVALDSLPHWLPDCLAVDSTGHAIPCELTAFLTSVPDALPYGDPGSGQAALPGKSRRLVASKPSFSETHNSPVAAGHQ